MTETTPEAGVHALDEHGHLAWTITRTPERTDFRLALPEPTRPELLPRLLGRLAFTLDGEAVEMRAASSHEAQGWLPTGKRAEVARVSMNGQPFAEAGMEEGGFRFLLPPIVTSELRQLGEYPRFTFYPRHPGMELPLLKSDFHTHSSGELSGADSIEIARAHGVAYPVRLLLAAGIAQDELPPTRTLTPRIVFPPRMIEEASLPMIEEAVSLSDLTPAQRARLASAMDAPFDGPVTFYHMENELYRYRTPITKPPELVGPTQLKIAANYAATGIHYAEITMTGMDKSETLKAIHAAVPQAKAEHGVDLRYLVGIPRTYDEAQLTAAFARARELMASPYIMGIDIIGYETNKTADIMHHLEDFADWCHANGHSEVTIRAHAGENAKNPDNVFHMLQLADRKNVRVRIGHAVYGLDAKALDLAEQLVHRGLVTMEFNPPSNIVLNNVDRLSQIPFDECIRRGIPFIVSKDGSGIMNATSQEVALQMHAAGLGQQAFKQLAATEIRLIARQLAYGSAKEKGARADHSAFAQDPSRFVDDLARDIAAVPMPPPGPARRIVAFNDDPVLSRALRMVGSRMKQLESKLPILMIGASGTSWAEVDRSGQEDAAIAIDMLTQTLDPEKLYFVHGRPKAEGVTRQLASSLSTLEKRHFAAEGVITNDHLAEHLRTRQQIAPHVTHLKRIDGTLLNVGTALVSIAAQGGPLDGKPQPGIVIAFGGKAFTRDIILEAARQNLPLYLMRSVAGASRDKALVMDEKYDIADARGLLTRLSTDYPSLFALQLDAERIDAVYHDARRRVHHAWAVDTYSDEDALAKWSSRRSDASPHSLL